MQLWRKGSRACSFRIVRSCAWHAHVSCDHGRQGQDAGPRLPRAMNVLIKPVLSEGLPDSSCAGKGPMEGSTSSEAGNDRHAAVVILVKRPAGRLHVTNVEATRTQTRQLSSLISSSSRALGSRQFTAMKPWMVYTAALVPFQSQSPIPRPNRETGLVPAIRDSGFPPLTLYG